jgi:hypothetical protein
MTQQPTSIPETEVYQQLLNRASSLILATINLDGTPLASYSPFID